MDNPEYDFVDVQVEVLTSGCYAGIDEIVGKTVVARKRTRKADGNIIYLVSSSEVRKAIGRKPVDADDLPYPFYDNEVKEL